MVSRETGIRITRTQLSLLGESSFIDAIFIKLNIVPCRAIFDQLAPVTSYSLGGPVGGSV